MHQRLWPIDLTALNFDITMTGHADQNSWLLPQYYLRYKDSQLYIYMSRAQQNMCLGPQWIAMVAMVSGIAINVSRQQNNFPK